MVSPIASTDRPLSAIFTVIPLGLTHNCFISLPSSKSARGYLAILQVQPRGPPILLSSNTRWCRSQSRLSRWTMAGAQVCHTLTSPSSPPETNAPPEGSTSSVFISSSPPSITRIAVPSYASQYVILKFERCRVHQRGSGRRRSVGWGETEICTRCTVKKVARDHVCGTLGSS